MTFHEITSRVIVRVAEAQLLKLIKFNYQESKLQTARCESLRWRRETISAYKKRVTRWNAGPRGLHANRIVQTFVRSSLLATEASRERFYRDSRLTSPRDNDQRHGLRRYQGETSRLKARGSGARRDVSRGAGDGGVSARRSCEGGLFTSDSWFDKAAGPFIRANITGAQSRGGLLSAHWS